MAVRVSKPTALAFAFWAGSIVGADVLRADESDSLSAEINVAITDNEYARALELAQRLQDLRRADPAIPEWKRGDVARLVEDLEFVLTLPDSARLELSHADRLTRDIWELKEQGEYTLGAQRAREQLAIRERHLGPGHHKVASSLHSLAVMLRRQGDYATARTLGEQALAIQEKVLGSEHPIFGRTLNSQAILLKQTGDFNAAREVYERALAVTEQAQGPGHPDVAVALNNLANLCRSIGAYAEARAYHERALAIREKAYGSNHPAVAHSLFNLANLIFDESGDYDLAGQLYARALRIREEVLGPEHPDVGLTYNSMAILHERTGDFVGARQLYERAIGIQEKALGPEHADVALTMSNLGGMLRLLGDREDARRLLTRALAIREKIYGPQHPSLAYTLSPLALLYEELGELDLARLHSERALAVREKGLTPQHPLVARSLNTLGILLGEMGDYQTAQQHFQRALEIRRDALGPDHPDVAEVLENLAVLLQRTGRPIPAQSFFAQALEVREQALGRQHPNVGQCLTRIGLLAYSMNDDASAEASFTRAAEIFEVARLRAGRGLLRATFQASPYIGLAATRLRLGKIGEAWPAAERARGRALADLLMVADQRSLTPREIATEDSLKRALTRLEDRMRTYEAAVSQDLSGEVRRQLEETRMELLDAEAALRVFQERIAAKYPVTEGQAYGLAEVQTSLSRETAILGWLQVDLEVGVPVSYGYVIRATGPVTWVPITSPVQSHDEALDYRQAIDMAASWQVRVIGSQEIDALASNVYARWIAPLMPCLTGADHLVVIPSGPLLGIPLEAVRASDGEYLGDEFAISYAPSATIHTWLWRRSVEESARGPRRALLLGDPPFTAEQLTAMEREEDPGSPLQSAADPFLRNALSGNADALRQLGRLPWTRKEVRRIAAVIPEGILLLGPDASEEALTQVAAAGDLVDFDMIHLATHAFVDDDAPERSALILARANLPDPWLALRAGERIYDGLLTAKEIVREWKLGADLVVLSGCQTGLGREVTGEGYIGLTHAFLQAGARSVLVSLWRVEDEATCLLMGRFYENLIGSRPDAPAMSKAEALREAKHWLRTWENDAGHCIFQHPIYWSGFILIGDPR